MSLWKNRNKKNKWLVKGLICGFAAAIIYTSCFGIFRDRAQEYVTDPTTSENNIAWLYESAYVLYKDLYNTVNGTSVDYRELYLQPQEGYEWILEEQRLNDYYERLTEPVVDESTTEPLEQDIPQPTVSAADGETTAPIVADRYDGWIQDNIEGMIADLERFHEYYGNLEESFSYLNYLYGYHIMDNVTGQVITNLSMEDMSANKHFFHLSFVFDEVGNITVGEDLVATDADAIRKYANGEIRGNSSQNPVAEELSSLKNFLAVKKPVNCTVTYCITDVAWANMTGGFLVNDYGRGDFNISRYVDDSMRYAYTQAGAGAVLTVMFLFVGVCGFIFTGKKETELQGGGQTILASLEFLGLGGLLWYAFGGTNLTRWVPSVAEGDAAEILKYAIAGRPYVASILVYCLTVLFLTVFFLGAWYIGFCVSEIKELGFRGYVRKHSIIYRFFPYIKRKCMETYEKIANIDLTKDANKTIIRLLVVNGIILLAISSLWVVGWVAVIIYSLLLYVVIRKYVSDLQKRYRTLLNATNEIAKGNLNVSIDENLGVFEPFKPEIIKIQEGFKHAVDQEVKSQRMKSELITNVSHDLKTPLTAIITYVNLLKEKNLTEEQREEYLDTLERKSLRLKVLIEDLFEVSKANSNNVTLNIMDVDIMNLVKQVSFEMSDKLEAADLDVRLNLPEGRIALPLDSQKTYRVYENLFANVAKYAMPGTRVYVSGALRDGRVEIILKNITAQEITVDSAELTERFVRNDASRNTEGSGLGLAIAKSFMELQGGELKVEVDGDLFKATTSWPIDKNPA